MRLNTHSPRIDGVKGAPNSPHRIDALDGTRGLAVILVFFVHYHALFKTYLIPDSINFAVSRFLEVIGHFGVDLFFMLSGYLIYGIVIQQSPRYSVFLFRRIKRLYPTFLFVLALYTLLSFALPSRSKLPSNLSEASVYLLRNIALIPGVFPSIPIITITWTLSYEIAFYLSLPLFVGLLGMRSWKRWQRVVLFLTLVLFYIGFSLVAGKGQYLRMVMFAVGILLRETLDYNGIKERLTVLGEGGAVLFYLGSLLLVYWVYIHPSSLGLIPKFQHRCRVGQYFLMAIGSFAFGVYCFGFDGALNKIFSWLPIRRLGEMSYSYYLIHGLSLNGAAWVATRSLPPSKVTPILFWAMIPFAFAITLVTARLLFNYVEKPYSLRQSRPKSVSFSGLGSPSPVFAVSGAEGASVQ